MGALAIFPWGDVIEEFLDPLKLSLEDYTQRMQGGWLFGYAAGLQRHGWRVVIVHASEQVRVPERLTHRETGAAVWIVPGRRSGQGAARDRPSLRAAAQWARTPWAAFAQVLRREACDAVMIQDYEHPRFDALVGLANLLRIPAFATFQGGDVTGSPLEAYIRGSSLARCRALVAPSVRERGRLAATYRALPPLLDIPNPVNVELWAAEPKAAARQALGIAADALLVVNHGRIDIHRKGLDVLLQAWDTVSAGRPGAQLAVIGSGQDHAQFAPMASGARNVTWHGEYVTDPPFIRRWLSAADVYVTLSRTEGMPVAPLEAMACGLPVVASDAHGLADIFQDQEAAGGLLVPRDDPGAAAAALERLADDRGLRSRLGQAARARVEARYGVASVGAALAEMLARGAGRREIVSPGPVAAVVRA